MGYTIKDFARLKSESDKITLLTAYDYITGKLADEAGVEAILIGDSLGMVSLGYPTTLQVTMEDMIHHSRAASRGIKNALLITDMPFMSYRTSIHESVRNAGRLVQEGMANCIKLEGADEYVDHIKAIVKAQIPVMGHLGLTPQSVNAFGGFKVQAKTEKEAKKLKEDALKLQEAGCFALVLEGIPHQLAKEVTHSLEIPTIGIGAGKYCDGQVLVWNDVLGMDKDFKPKFVKQYMQGHLEITSAFQQYIKEVKEGNFPDEEHSFK